MPESLTDEQILGIQDDAPAPAPEVLRRFREVTLPRPPKLIHLRFSRHARTCGLPPVIA